MNENNVFEVEIPDKGNSIMTTGFYQVIEKKSGDVQQFIDGTNAFIDLSIGESAHLLLFDFKDKREEARVGDFLQIVIKCSFHSIVAGEEIIRDISEEEIFNFEFGEEVLLFFTLEEEKMIFDKRGVLCRISAARSSSKK